MVLDAHKSSWNEYQQETNLHQRIPCVKNGALLVAMDFRLLKRTKYVKEVIPFTSL